MIKIGINERVAIILTKRSINLFTPIANNENEITNIYMIKLPNMELIKRLFVATIFLVSPLFLLASAQEPVIFDIREHGAKPGGADISKVIS